MEEPPLTAVGIVRALPGRGEELGRRMAALVAPTTREPGCLRYELYRSTEQPEVWMLLEQWRTEAALEVHIGSAHLQAFLTIKDEVLAGAPQSYRFRRVDPALVAP